MNTIFCMDYVLMAIALKFRVRNLEYQASFTGRPIWRGSCSPCGATCSSTRSNIRISALNICQLLCGWTGRPRPGARGSCSQCGVTRRNIGADSRFVCYLLF